MSSHHRYQHSNHSVPGTLIGRTKVRGQEYLTDGLALALLKRQQEKKSHPVDVKFTEDYVQFMESGRHRSRYEDDLPYDLISKVYTFNDHPDILMTCSHLGYDESRSYASFRLHNSDDVCHVRKMIVGGYYEPRTHSRSISQSRTPRRSVIQYDTERPIAYTHYEPSTQYRVVSRTYRTQSRSPSPIYVERAETRTPVVERVETVPVVERVESVPVVERVIPVRSPSPIYVQSAPTTERVITTYQKPVETYPPETTTDKVVYRRVQSKPEGSVRTTYVTRPTVTYMEGHTHPRNGASSRLYMDGELEDDDIVLKRVSRVPPVTK